MASIYCPECEYEVPLDDITGKPILEIHQKGCKAFKPGTQEHKKWASLLEVARERLLGEA